MQKGRKNGSTVYKANLIREKIHSLMVNGVTSQADIKNYILKNHPEFNIKERQIYEYIRQVSEWFVEKAKVNREKMLGETLSRIEDLYIKNQKKGAFAECRALLEFQMKLFKLEKINEEMGIIEPIKIEIIR